MSYYVHTQKASKIVNKDLFRLNNISYEEMLENLMILLDGEKYESTATIANLPSNNDVSKSLHLADLPRKPLPILASDVEDRINTMCAVVWANDRRSYSWYLGYIKKVSEDGEFMVDHLTRTVRSSDTSWKYPSSADTHFVTQEQIIDCEIDGEWDMKADSRKRLFTLNGSKAISYAYKKHISKF